MLPTQRRSSSNASYINSKTSAVHRRCVVCDCEKRFGQGFGNEVGNTVFQETGSKIAASAAAGATRGAVSTASK